MWVSGVMMRDFRGYCEAHVRLGRGLTVVWGPNGAGKTNLLEGLYFGCTGRSCRTVNEREVVRFGAGATRVVISAHGEDGQHELSVGFVPGQPKHARMDGAAVDRLLDATTRPLVSVFLPDRLELVKGKPALRRAHLDQLVMALWPGRSATRRAYAQALLQRNALISRIRSSSASRASLSSWDLQLARHGVALMKDRANAVESFSDRFSKLGAALGLDGPLLACYRPRSSAHTPEELAAELTQRIDGDLGRGFTSHGPHRDDLALLHRGRDLRTYGSQGQQRLALLALLLAEREAIGDRRGTLPLMLLDDVMSELDRPRREALIDLLRTGGSQSVITTTDLEQVPGADGDDVARVAVSGGQVFVDPVGEVSEAIEGCRRAEEPV